MGGVIITLDENEAGKRFIELGMKEFAEKMDPYKQVGLNGQLEEGKISEDLIDESCMRILELKNKLGLFENPYKDADAEKEKAYNL